MTQAPVSPFAQSIASGFGEFAPPLAVIGAGRLMIFIPRSPVTETPSKFKDPVTNLPKMTNQLIVDMVICDGPPISFGANPAERRPDSHRTEIPTVFRSVQIKGNRLIDQIVNSAASGIPMGRLGQKPPGNGGNLMWELISPTKEDNDIAMAACAQLNAWVLWDLNYQGQQMNIPPLQLLAQPQQAQFSGPPAAGQWLGQGGMPAPQMPQAPAMPQWPATQPGMVAQPMSYPVPQAPAQQFQQQPAGAPPNPFLAVPAAPADWTLNLAAFQQRGFQWPADLATWNGMSPEQRTQFLGSQGITTA